MPQPEENDVGSRKGGRQDSSAQSPSALRVAPHNFDAEEALLACCLIDSVSTLSLSQEKGITGESFYRPAHRILYQVIEEMQRNNVAVDIITLTDYLSGRTLGSLPGRDRDPDADKKLYEYVGGQELLGRITSRIESTIHAQHWMDIVFDKWVLRRLIATATGVVEGCYVNEGRIDEFIDDVEREIFEIGQQRVVDAAKPISKSIDEATALINRIMKGESTSGVLTGYEDLDRLTMGLHKGEMIVLAARPSMGKTSLAMNIAEQAAIPRHGEPAQVLVFSLEMVANDLVLRLLCRRAKVNIRRVHDGKISKEDSREIATAASELKKASLWIDDGGHLTILALRAKARRMQARLESEGRGKLGLIVIDYLQLIAGMGDSRTPREQQISEISRGIKSLAKELQVPVLVLSQLNREAEKENRPPRLSDLRESGSIEQDADVVLLLAKDKDSDDKSSVPSGTRKVELIVAKQRNGPVGMLPLTFIPEYTSFENYTESA